MPKGDDKRADATSAGSDSKAERKAKGQGPSGAVGQSSASRKSEPAHGNAWAWVTTRTGLPMPAVAGVAGALVMLALLLAWFLLLRPRAAITAVFAIPAYKVRRGCRGGGLQSCLMPVSMHMPLPVPVPTQRLCPLAPGRAGHGGRAFDPRVLRRVQPPQERHPRLGHDGRRRPGRGPGAGDPGHAVPEGGEQGGHLRGL